LREEAFAAAIAINVGGIEKSSRRGRASDEERPGNLYLRRCPMPPPMAHAPKLMVENFVAGPAKFAIFHTPPSLTNCSSLKQFIIEAS